MIAIISEWRRGATKVLGAFSNEGQVTHHAAQPTVSSAQRRYRTNSPSALTVVEHVLEFRGFWQSALGEERMWAGARKLSICG